MEYNIAGRILCFDSRLQHRALPHKGSRISIVAFHPASRGMLSPGMQGQLKQLGFALDVPRWWRSPVRIALDPAAITAGSCLYVGPHCKRLGLRGSSWAALWEQGPGVTWRQAAEIMARKLAQDPKLVRGLRDLEGRLIACTCAVSSRCHGDWLIEAFNKLRADLLAADAAPAPHGRGHQAGSI